MPNLADLLERPVEPQKKSKSTPSIQNTSTTSDLPTPKLPTKDPGFEKFMRWFSKPEYKGLFEWQKEHHRLTWEAKYDMTCVPRDHGKSIGFNGKYQYSMQYLEFDILLLGWTDRRKEIANYVYNFFLVYDLIERDKRTSPFHFKIKNGGKFDCYLITSKETLGMHSEGEQKRFSDMSDEDWEEYKTLFEVDLDVEGDRALTENELKEYIESRTTSNRKLWISIDDPIDESFMKERHKEESLEMHFNSALYGIHPYKWSFTGTRKFEGDFFDFIDKKFGKELVKYIRKTRYPDGRLLCPERFTHPDVDTYEMDLKEGKMDLDQIRRHVGEYTWFSEYEQEPHPITGEVWDHVAYEYLLNDPVNRNYDICWITVDRATTTGIKSDFTGCVIGLREMGTGLRLATHDFTDKIPIDQLLIQINDFIDLFHSKHPSVLIVLIVEKQGGGDDFITLAKNSIEFIKTDNTHVRNVIPEYAVIEEIHNTGEKMRRIEDRLRAPLGNERLRFLITLKGSEIVKEILNHPHANKVDAIDAVANMEFVLLSKYPVGQTGTYLDDMIRLYDGANKQEQRDYETSMSDLKEILESRYARKFVFEG